jgi:hypothetical protein
MKKPDQSTSSRRRYRQFVADYRHRRLDTEDEQKPAQASDIAPAEGAALEAPAAPVKSKTQRRAYLREYFRWLWPHRTGVSIVFALALTTAGLQMLEPLFMRFIINRVLLNDTLAQETRLSWLHQAGGAFLGVIVLSNLISLLKDYRQRIGHRDSPVPELATGAGGAGNHPGRDADELCVGAPHPADLSHHSQGRRADRRPRR